MTIRRGFLTALAAPLLLSAACSPLFGERRPTSVAPSPTPDSQAFGTLTPTAGPSLTPEPFALDLTPVPTSTALPTLELPTPSGAGGDLVWDGLPTYPAESYPGAYFRVSYDPVSWALTTDQFGIPALGHRAVAGCVMTPSAGRGLPLNARVDHTVRLIGRVTFQVDTASVGGVRQFVSYTGGNGVIYTGFVVQVTEMADLCLPAAEIVLGTLRSVPAAEATPAVTR